MSILYSSLQTAYDEMSGWLHRTVHEESSTRTLGLVRILLGLIALAEHAAEFRLFNRLHAIDLTLSVAFYVSIPMLIIGYRSRFAAFFAGSTLLSSWWLLGEYGGDPARPARKRALWP